VLVKFHAGNKDMKINVAVIKDYKYVYFLLKKQVAIVVCPIGVAEKMGVNKKA